MNNLLQHPAAIAKLLDGLAQLINLLIFLGELLLVEGNLLFYFLELFTEETQFCLLALRKFWLGCEFVISFYKAEKFLGKLLDKLVTELEFLLELLSALGLSVLEIFGCCHGALRLLNSERLLLNSSKFMKSLGKFAPPNG